MRIKVKLTMFLLTVVTLLMTLAGCAIGMGTLEDILEEKEVVSQITYYSNGGWFDGSTGIVERTLGYKENSKLFEITEESVKVKVSRDDYNYIGWYKIQTVEREGTAYFVCDIASGEDVAQYAYPSGESSVACVEKVGDEYLVKALDFEKLVRAKKVPLLKYGEKFEFDGTLKNGEHLYLIAKWEPDQKVEYVLLTEDCTSINVTVDGETVTYQNGDIVGSQSFNENGVATRRDYYIKPIKNVQDATFVDYYVYEETPDLNNLTKAFATPIPRPEDGTNVKVFVKYVAGDWEIIRAPKDVSTIFSRTSGKHYVANDIDCTNAGLSAINCVSGNYNATVRGNGYEIKGITLKSASLGSGGSAGMFGTLTSSTKIHDITFTDVTFNVTTAKRTDIFVNAYLIASGSTANAEPTLENVTFANVTLNLTLENGVNVHNIPLGTGGYDTSRWLYAGSASNTAFTAEFTSVTLTNCKLIINTEQVDQINPVS